MRQHLQQVSRKLVILLLEALVIGGLIVFAFILKPSPNTPPKPIQPTLAAPTVQAKPPLTHDHATTVLELFNPTDQSLTNQLNETSIRQNIEQIVATTYVLANCKRIDTESYRNSFRALMVYAQTTKLAASSAEADTKVRQISQAASASYSMLYYRTKCDDPKLDSATAQLIAWQKSQLRE